MPRGSAPLENPRARRGSVRKPQGNNSAAPKQLRKDNQPLLKTLYTAKPCLTEPIAATVATAVGSTAAINPGLQDWLLLLAAATGAKPRNISVRGLKGSRTRSSYAHRRATCQKLLVATVATAVRPAIWSFFEKGCNRAFQARALRDNARPCLPGKSFDLSARHKSSLLRFSLS